MPQTLKVNLFNITFIDTIISSETPGLWDFFLLQVVIKHNIHNLRGHLNLSTVCVIDEICSEHFPQDFVDETSLYKSRLCVT